MTLRTAVFEQQITRLRAEGYQFLPLLWVLEGLYQGVALPDKAIAITVDDDHRSVYTELRPIIVRENLPVTLFIYPSAISNASYAMTWDQLAEMQKIPGVDIQSQTYWHPNFRTEKKRLSPEAYAAFVKKQLELPRTILYNKLGVNATLLSWPFGIRDTTRTRPPPALATATPSPSRGDTPAAATHPTRSHATWWWIRRAWTAFSNASGQAKHHSNDNADDRHPDHRRLPGTGLEPGCARHHGHRPHRERNGSHSHPRRHRDCRQHRGARRRGRALPDRGSRGGLAGERPRGRLRSRRCGHHRGRCPARYRACTDPAQGPLPHRLRHRQPRSARTALDADRTAPSSTPWSSTSRATGA